MSYVLLQGHELLRLDGRYWLGAPNGWDITGHPQVIDHSVEEPIHLIFIRSTWRSYLHPQIWIGRRIVPISLSQLAIIGLLKMKNNNLQNKMVEQTYHKVLSATCNELLHPLF